MKVTSNFNYKRLRMKGPIYTLQCSKADTIAICVLADGANMRKGCLGILKNLEPIEIHAGMHEP